MNNIELQKSITILQKQLSDLSSLINKNDTNNSNDSVTRDVCKNGGGNISSRYRKSVM